MYRIEAIELLKRGPEGVKEWNALDPGVRRGVDLRNADLRDANLSNAGLRIANLRDVDLRGTDLSGADLSGADLRNADLRNAELNAANLSGANLRGVDLKQAFLVGTKLNGAKLRDANLSGAMSANTSFSDVDLSEVRGLEEVQHGAPSSVGLDTIQKSGGKIPEVFLRGCGVPEEWITYLPSLIGSLSAIDFYSCFISYSHKNKSFARRLHDSLQGRGIRCWLDEKQILPGDDIYKKVDDGLKLWDKVLLCASETSLNSWWVEREIDRALEREMNLKKERGESVLSIVPLNLDGHLFKWDHHHASALKKRLASDFTEWDINNAKFEEQFELLVKALRADDGAREDPPESKL